MKKLSNHKDLLLSSFNTFKLTNLQISKIQGGMEYQITGRYTSPDGSSYEDRLYADGYQQCNRYVGCDCGDQNAD